jgi:hypothetical protein
MRPPNNRLERAGEAGRLACALDRSDWICLVQNLAIF